MFWYPYTGSVPYALSWSAGLFTTALAIAALVGAVRVALLALRPALSGHAGPRSEAVSVPFDPVVVVDAPEVKRDAA
jgi:hypothetical protein